MRALSPRPASGGHPCGPSGHFSRARAVAHVELAQFQVGLSAQTAAWGQLCGSSSAGTPQPNILWGGSTGWLQVELRPSCLGSRRRLQGSTWQATMASPSATLLVSPLTLCYESWPRAGSCPRASPAPGHCGGRLPPGRQRPHGLAQPRQCAGPAPAANAAVPRPSQHHLP